MPEMVHYRISLARRHRHLYDVEARFPASGATLELKLPVWTPGSYLIREYQRHLQDLTCSDETGRSLPVSKTAKATWRIELGGAREVRARYAVYAHELTVRTSHLDDSHAYWNGATLFLYVDELRGAPHRVTIADLPSGWHVSTGLAPERTGHSPPAHASTHTSASYLAPDHDTLVDSPFEVGTHERHTFQVDGKPHELAIWGRSDLDRARLIDDIQRVIGVQAQLFGGLPYDRYTFILHLIPGGYGGLEHRNSCTLLANPFAHHQRNKYLDLLELISHEFFHLWNVKRIHPQGLGPFDYQQEVHTRSLWVVEGWTSYYDRLMLRRASLMKTERYLEKLGEELTKMSSIAGRKHQSLEEASFDAWIKLYRPDENTANTTISYYLKGSIVALLLDLEIRRRSRYERTLDDVMRALWEDRGVQGRGYGETDIERLIEQMTGASFKDFFDRSVHGREELDLDGPLAAVGLRCRPIEPPGDGDTTAHTGAWLGASFGTDMKVTETAEDGPAQNAGLSPGDQVVAFNGWRVDEALLREHLSQVRPGHTARLTFFRRDQLSELTVTLGRSPRHKIEIIPVEDASPQARAAYQAWLGESWSPGKG